MMEEHHPLGAGLHQRLEILLRGRTGIFEGRRSVRTRYARSPDRIEEQEHIKAFCERRVEKGSRRGMLDMRPANLFAQLVEHDREPFAIVRVPFGDEHHSDWACAALRIS